MDNFKMVDNSKKHLKWVNKYFVNNYEVTGEIVQELLDSNALFFDTESCPLFKGSEKEKVYIWQLGGSNTDYVVYGESLKEFIEFMEFLADTSFSLMTVSKKGKPLKKTKKVKGVEVERDFTKTFEIYVHNLSWDIEFLKYYLVDNDFNYFVDKGRKEGRKCKRNKVKNFNIVENQGTVYSANIFLEDTTVNDFNCYTTLKFFDSAKITVDSLEKIASKYITIPESFHKLKEEYEYGKIREEGYRHTDVERRYCYNDIFIMREWYLQYYCGLLLSNKKTLSGITFEKCIANRYNGESNSENYEMFKLDYPDVIGITSNVLINQSYKGGYTHCGYDFNSKRIDDINILSGCSIDINSSYPYQMKYGKLPYGQPVYFKGQFVQKNNEYDIYLQKIKFDGFAPKDKNNKMGIIKTTKGLREVFELSANEYSWTNICDDYVICDNIKKDSFNYEMVLTNTELDFWMKHYDFYVFKDREGSKRIKNLEKGLVYECGLKFKSKIGDFGNYIDWCIEGKVKAKKDKNDSLYNMYKVLMNAIYGKFASNPEREERDLRFNSNGTIGYKSVGVDYLAEQTFYKAYASFVTSLARVKLQKTILEVVGDENFYYCDTDSIYCSLPIEELRERFKHIIPKEVEKENQFLDGNVLGAWDIEHIFKDSKWLGQKKYLIFDNDGSITCKCAGLPKGATKKIISKDMFYLGKVFTDKKQKRKVIGGYRLEETTFEIKDYTLNL